jgi:3-isopropylmalate/(R)-2-methylmalate dehydratase small subunit
MSATVVTGRAWVFAEANVNTDLMMPATLFRASRAEQAAQLFGGYRPGWAGTVEAGDVIVAGRNFGTGSSRPAPSLMADLGIRAVLAESLNGLFFRNCINAGVAAAECAGILGLVAEGDVVSYDLRAGLVTNSRTGASLPAPSLPDELIGIIADGGLLARLERAGHVRVTRGSTTRGSTTRGSRS